MMVGFHLAASGHIGSLSQDCGLLGHKQIRATISVISNVRFLVRQVKISAVKKAYKVKKSLPYKVFLQQFSWSGRKPWSNKTFLEKHWLVLDFCPSHRYSLHATVTVLHPHFWLKVQILTFHFFPSSIQQEAVAGQTTIKALKHCIPNSFVVQQTNTKTATEQLRFYLQTTTSSPFMFS